jgi:hypothetical protein
VACRPHAAHYKTADLVDGPGGDWNSFVFVGDPDGNGWTLQERPDHEQAIDRRSRHGR